LSKTSGQSRQTLKDQYMNDMDNIDKILGVKVKGQVLPGGIIRCPETC
jgi:hypothetical protein